MYANFLIHEQKPWKEVPRYWQVRALQLLINTNGEIVFDDRYPTMALIFCDEPVSEEELEHMFRITPDENFYVVSVENVPASYPKPALFETWARHKNIAPVQPA